MNALKAVAVAVVVAALAMLAASGAAAAPLVETGSEGSALSDAARSVLTGVPAIRDIARANHGDRSALAGGCIQSWPYLYCDWGHQYSSTPWTYNFQYYGIYDAGNSAYYGYVSFVWWFNDYGQVAHSDCNLYYMYTYYDC
jgi:hypothetical protein